MSIDIMRYSYLRLLLWYY